MKKVRSTAILIVGIFFLVSLLISGTSKSAVAAEFELKYGGLAPEALSMARLAKSWMAKIEKETNGRVHFTQYWGGTLITPPDAPNEVAKGVVDVGDFSADYPKVGFDLVKNTGTFYFGINSPPDVAKLFTDLRKKFPQIDKEYTEYGKILVKDKVLAPAYLMTRKPVRTLQDFKGLKIKTIPAYAPLLHSLGAEAVMMSMFDVYLAVQKGTIDGLMAPWDAFVPLKFYEVVKGITLLNLTYCPQMGFLMNWKTWNGLPPDIQNVIENNMKFFSDENLRLMAEESDKARKVALEHGIEVIELPDADKKQVQSLVYQESLKKAAELDAKGLPGTALLKEIRTFMEK